MTLSGTLTTNTILNEPACLVNAVNYQLNLRMSLAHKNKYTCYLPDVKSDELDGVSEFNKI